LRRKDKFEEAKNRVRPLEERGRSSASGERGDDVTHSLSLRRTINSELKPSNAAEVRSRIKNGNYNRRKPDPTNPILEEETPDRSTGDE